MKTTEITETTICCAQCDWIAEQAKMLKALFRYDDPNMLAANKTRVLSAIDTMEASLRELKLCFEELGDGN